jgi:hypothetical protein
VEEARPGSPLCIAEAIVIEKGDVRVTADVFETFTTCLTLVYSHRRTVL